MNIGNIVSSSKINEDNFKLFNEIESVDNSLPTLIVGWGHSQLLKEGWTMMMIL